MSKENRITKTQRIKINIIEAPTSNWIEFGHIFKLLQNETILASNKVINICNIYNALGKSDGDKWLMKYGSDKIRNAIYKVARECCPLQYSGSTNMISDNIYKNYFCGEKSWKRKIEAGEGNPPMTFTDTIPINVRGDCTKIECIDEMKGYYSLTSSFLSLSAKANLEYTTYRDDENGKKKKEKHHIDIVSNQLKFYFTVKKNGKLESLINNLLTEGSGYKTGDSQLMRKRNKKTKQWEYWFMLSYSYDRQNPIKELNPDRIMGVDVGIVVPLYATVSDMEWRKEKFGDSRIHKQAIRDIVIRAEAQKEITYNLRDSHGRKCKLDGFNGADNKTKNRQNTYNHVLSRQLVNRAIKLQCGKIYMEDLSGLKEKEKENLFLQNWTYNDLQEKIIQKSKEVGIVVARVNRFGTSQTCPCCGYRDKGNRPKGKMGQAYFKCLHCGYEDNADHVAAINILRSEPLKGKVYNL